ncbi:probable ubiquitin-like-specific protease 2B isoform X2 [Morus notabilis]|uniref:probable ubiquitin-like-specific protease 2B isoform X2 n=1 Tax=Morus notabilis TaxID=981085 RepID=UPI000CED0025|nr:probable ubiquitin-like-specific protease 2B isoform X2 [Morus notabilis]
MKSSPHRGMEVFDFKEPEENSESAVDKYDGKLKNPSSDDDDALKYEFLGFAAQETPTKETGSAPCVDVDAVDCELSCGNATSYVPLDKAEEKIDSGTECFNAAPQLQSSSHEECPEFRPLDNHGSRSFLSEAEKRCSDLEAPSPGKSQLNCDRLDSPSNNEPVDMTSDVDQSMNESSPSSPASGMAEDDDLLNNHAIDHCSGDTEMDDMNTTVVLYPDYVIYRDSYCTGPKLTFSNSYIKLTGSTGFESREAFDFEWGIDDLVNIQCQWFERAETVMIKLEVISRDAFQEDGGHGPSGVEELKIVAVESNWSQKQDDIASLHQRYIAVWQFVQDCMDMGTYGDDSPCRGRYFPVFDESFEEVIYPKGDTDAVSISKRDVDLLQPETFINDTIVDFYIKYLKNQIQPEERQRFHFFNSFFFRKLADLDKDPSSAADGKAAFQRVRKWTRKVDLFEKEFIFIPINFSLHWSLVVICHPGEVATFQDEDLDKSLKVPCILHMDSIKGNHSGLKNLIQSYLWEEWKERRKETSEEMSSRFHNLRFVSLELPQQENSFDCGLFLLHYLELFLAEVPSNFSPFKITKSSNFLNINWFPPSEASLKRTLIQRLIFDLLEKRSREVSSSPSSDEDPLPYSNRNDVAMEFLSTRCNPGLSCQDNLSSSQAGQGIEMTLLSSSSMRPSQCVNDSGLVLKDLFDPGASAGSLMGQCQSFDQKSSYYRLNGAISQLEEDTETGEQFMFLPSGESGCQLAGITSQTCGIPYPPKNYGGDTYDIGISLQAEHRDMESSSDCVSDDSSDVAITETFPVVERSSPKQEEKTDEQSSQPVENIAIVTEGLVSASHVLPEGPAAEASHKQVGNEVLPDEPDGQVSQNDDVMLVGNGVLPDVLDAQAAQNHDMMPVGNESGLPIPSFLEYPDMTMPQDSIREDNGVGSNDGLQVIENDLVDPDLPRQQPAKKPRLAPSSEDSCHGVQMIDNGLVIPGSLGQQPAEKLRLSPSMEVKTRVVESLDEDSHL